MALEIIDPTSDSLALAHFLSVTANVLERYNTLLSSDSSDVDVVTKILTQTTEAYELYIQLKNSSIDNNVAESLQIIEDLKVTITTTIESLTQDFNNNKDTLTQSFNDNQLALTNIFNQKIADYETRTADFTALMGLSLLQNTATANHIIIGD